MAKKKKVKSNIIKWLLGYGEEGTKRRKKLAQERARAANKPKPPKPPPKNKPKPPKPPPKNKPKPPKPNVRQRKDGRWAVVGKPNKTYASQGAATRAFNQQQKAAAAAKRKEDIGKGIGAGVVITLGTSAATRSDKKDDKNKGEGPTRKSAEALKPAAKTATQKRTAAELELIPKGARPPAAKKPAAKPATTKRTAEELELIPKGAKPAARKTDAKKSAAKTADKKIVAANKKTDVKKSEPKKLKSFEQGVRYVDTPFGKIKMDTTDKGMAFEEYDAKYGGQVKGKVKRRMGGIVKKGYGKAQRGY